MNYLITGGTGFLGTRLVTYLLKNTDNHIWITSRGKKSSDNPQLHYLEWDGKKINLPNVLIDVVINLAGKGIADQEWTAQHKKEVLESRIHAATACLDFIRNATQKPNVFIAGSAIGYYGGDRPGPEVDENSSPGNDFMAEVCTKWETASLGSGIRTVLLRTTVILGKEGGPFPQIYMPYKFFAGGPLGTGKQGFPWMHAEDWVRAVIFCIENKSISGPVILNSPVMTSHQNLSDAIAKAAHRPNIFRVPQFALNLMLGERAVMVWGGVFAHPHVLENAGFTWKFPKIEDAVKEILRS